MEPIMNIKKERLKLTPEQLFDIYLECNAPGAPVKTILARYDYNARENLDHFLGLS